MKKYILFSLVFGLAVVGQSVSGMKLSDLPQDLMAENIFSYLDTEGDKVCVYENLEKFLDMRYVCRSFDGAVRYFFNKYKPLSIDYPIFCKERWRKKFTKFIKEKEMNVSIVFFNDCHGETFTAKHFRECIETFKDHIVGISLLSCDQLTDDDLFCLAECKNLRELELQGCKNITADGLLTLDILKNLKKLFYRGDVDRLKSIIRELSLIENLDLERFEELGEAELKHVKKLSCLKSIEFMAPMQGFGADGQYIHMDNPILTGFSYLPESVKSVHVYSGLDLGQGELGNLPLGLKSLKLECEVNDEGMAALARLTNLKELELGVSAFSMNEIGNEGLKHLQNLNELKRLKLSNAKFSEDTKEITAQGIVFLPKNLSELYISGSFSHDCLEGIGEQFPCLRILHINFVTTRQTFVHLARLTQLREVSISSSGNPMLDEDLQQLQGMQNLEDFSFFWDDGNSVTNDGLQYLPRGLKKLTLQGFELTAQGVGNLPDSVEEIGGRRVCPPCTYGQPAIRRLWTDLKKAFSCFCCCGCCTKANEYENITKQAQPALKERGIRITDQFEI